MSIEPMTFLNLAQSVSLYILCGVKVCSLTVRVVVIRVWSELPPPSGLHEQPRVMLKTCPLVTVRSGIDSRYRTALGKWVKISEMFCSV